MAEPGAPADPILEISDLIVTVRSAGKARPILKNVGFYVGRREAVGLIGESGSGKSTIALSVMNYLAPNVDIASGSLVFAGNVDLRNSDRSIYGRRISYVAQDPNAALNPIMRIGRQMTEALLRHCDCTQKDARAKALSLLEEVRLPHGEAILEALPYQLSGGMQQRVCIAMALSCNPDLLVLDEPTTGLDARTEGAVLELLQALKKTRDLSILLISHNLAAISDLTDRVMVMYAGSIVESGPTAEILRKPGHRYTQMLLSAVPRMDSDRALVDAPWQEANFPESGCAFRNRCDLAIPDCGNAGAVVAIDAWRTSSCVRARDVLKGISKPDDRMALTPKRAVAKRQNPVALRASDISFNYGRSFLSDGPSRNVLDNVGVEIRQGTVTALIGESGSGKSTLARILVGLLHPKQGHISLKDRIISKIGRFPLDLCKRIQIVFQNVAGSLHPAKQVAGLLARPYQLYEKRNPNADELRSMLSPVGLRAEVLPKLAGSLSGGERQRLGLARASAPKPEIMILDEAFSALDVSMKVRVARYLSELGSSRGTGYLFVTHELPLVRYFADEVVVLYRGWVCEHGPTEQVFAPPYHPYTEALIWAARKLEGHSPAISQMFVTDESTGKVAPIARSGCPYHTGCQRKIGSICETSVPPIRRAASGHAIACHIPVEELKAVQTAEYKSIETQIAE